MQMELVASPCAQDSPVSSEEETDDGLNVTIDSTDGGSLYVPTPQRIVRKNACVVRNVASNTVCFMDLNQFDKFIKQVNEIRCCATPGCKGALTPVYVRSIGLGGAVSISCTCNGCGNQGVIFETSKYMYELGSATEISVAIQVAFIIAGCTHMTYYKVLKHALGIEAVSWPTFHSTVKRMYPVVKEMVDEMCEDAKDDMRRMDQNELGSWSRAVTSADGTWMTRGHHSKNATFSIRNYYNGALLYRKHLCQKGRDDVIKEELYQGTSKGAEGYAARLTFKKAKEEGMNIAIQWQDADSSSAKAVTDHFPNAEIMICGGHAGRAHKKQLEKLQKIKSFSADLVRKYKDDFSSVGDVVCHCSRHKQGCGCLSKAFIEKARNYFSFILSKSESAEEFATRVKGLAMHARDQHDWGFGRCDFHQLRVCSCGECEDGEDLTCEGKDYHTRHVLTCPFHSLAYEIECHERAGMAEQLVHPILKRGHSNWLEASHNVFIRFRPKHIFLERLHYVLSTKLALLQSNMTYMYDKRGPQYHWVVELFEHLKLPVFEGVQAALEAFNQQRKLNLDRQKTDLSKLRRIKLKTARKMDAQQHKVWSKKHGHDTYGSDDSDIDEDEKPRGQKKRMTGGQCKCGSTTHQRTNHSDCPYNPKNTISNNRKRESSNSVDDRASEDGNVVYYSEDSLSDAESIALKESVLTSTANDSWCFEDDIISGNLCLCGALGRAHKKECPLNSRNRYAGCTLFPNTDCGNGDKSKLPKTSKVGTGSTHLGKREEPTGEKPPPAKKRKHILKVGDCVNLHDSKLGKYHLPCCIVQIFGDRCLLCCRKGVLATGYTKGQLMAITGNVTISAENWRTAAKISLKKVLDDPATLEVCNCGIARPVVKHTVDLTEDSAIVSSDESSATVSNNWLSTPLYTLHVDKKQEILSPDGWLSDTVIKAAQLLILQEFPHIAGLQDPAVHNTLSFQVLRGEFVQIIFVGGCHWCTVSNVGCNDGVVNVYDSMYSSASSGTIKLIASLVFSPAKQLVVRMMDVGRQSNGSDCGVLALAFAYDICSGNDPCKIKYDHRSIRQHLADCLENGCLSRFPVVGERRTVGVRHTQSVDLHCSCRLPEEKGDKMAECDMCKTWYHQHCMGIPDNIFDSKKDVPCKCKSCSTE